MQKLPSISEASSIAIHALALLGSTGESFNVNRMAGKTGFSRNHISKVMQLLVRHGYLKSGRGPKGGFEILRPAEEISMLEIIELIEGKKDDIYCGIDQGQCPFETCVFGDLPGEFARKFREFYQNRKISEVKYRQGNASAV